jgi:hypothetical protein
MNSSFFALQLAIQSPPGDPWREHLVALLRENQSDQGVFEKRALYTRFANLLAQAEPRWVLGTWDYITGAKAETEFDSWVAGLEATVNEPLDPTAAAGDHAVVSAVFLVEAGSRSDTTLGERCDIPEAQWFTRGTYSRLVATLRMLTFASVLADGVYVVPGDVGYGLRLAELRGEGWEYLKPVE